MTHDPICTNCGHPTSEHVSTASWLQPDQSASKFICPTSVLAVDAETTPEEP